MAFFRTARARTHNLPPRVKRAMGDNVSKVRKFVNSLQRLAMIDTPAFEPKPINHTARRSKRRPSR